jgi:hypothetical protein
MVNERIMSEMWRIQITGKIFNGSIEHIFPNIKLIMMIGMIERGNTTNW